MIRLSPGGKASPSDRRAAETIQRLLLDELPRVRAAATAWRNGLAALLAGLLGFSLVKGRSDIGELAAPWHVIVGVLLLGALVAGTYGALRLLWAANGLPSIVDRGKVGSERSANHVEAVEAAGALRQGRAASLSCGALLVAAVAITWYGPAKGAPQLRVTTPTSTVCGSVVRLDAGALTLKTDSGEITVDLTVAAGIRAVETCRPGSAR